MATRDEKREWDFPHLREAHKFPDMGDDFWAVKFYPYTEPGIPPVFAAVGGKHIVVCRPSASKKEHYSRAEIIQLIIDEEVSLISELHENDSTIESRSESHYACTWSKDLTTGDPLLVVSGTSAKIKVFNALTGKMLEVLTGHGGEINDLVTSPSNPAIIASASEDCTVRIWSLDPAHEGQPCAAILEGEGHTDTVLSVAFHKNGRYLLSSGVDHVINLWTLPEFPNINTGTKKPTRIFYPHFSTSEIHSDIVDCIAWHGDLILSKAANEHNIVLWSINNFDSSLEPLSPDAAPTTHDPSRDTRSAFIPISNPFSSVSTSLFTRHLQFAIPDSSLMFMRFSLFDGLPPPISDSSSQSPTKSTTTNTSHPVLAFCNTASKVFFWDLSRFENYHDTMSPYTSDSETFSAPAKHPFLNPFQSRKRGGGGAIGRLSKRQRTNSPTDSTTSSQVTASDEQSLSYKDDSQEGQAQNQTRGRSRKSTINAAASSSFTSSEKEKERSRSEEKGKGNVDWVKTRKTWHDKYDIGDPLLEIQAHWTDVVKGLTMAGRQVAWSSDGKWCVVVGSGSVIAVFQRWRD